jgi:hypothetical protein
LYKLAALRFPDFFNIGHYCEHAIGSIAKGFIQVFSEGLNADIGGMGNLTVAKHVGSPKND